MPYHDLTQVNTAVLHYTAALKLHLDHTITKLQTHYTKLQTRLTRIPPHSTTNTASAPQTYRQKVKSNQRIDGWIRCTELGCNPALPPHALELCGESSLFYEKGPHPFGTLRCRYPCCIEKSVYGHGVVITEDTETSGTIRLFENAQDTVRVAPAVPQVLGSQVPFFTVCSACGLTHRARRVEGGWLGRVRGRVGSGRDKTYSIITFKHVERCDVGCRMVRDETWLRYSIHPVRGYHLPTESYNGYYGDVVEEDRD